MSFVYDVPCGKGMSLEDFDKKAVRKVILLFLICTHERKIKMKF